MDNAIFMNEDAIHNIYENKGNFDIIYQIPQILYSNIISAVINKIIRILSLSHDDVINKKNKLKREKENNEFENFFRALFIKYIFFFIISFLFLFFFVFIFLAFVMSIEIHKYILLKILYLVLDYH